MGKSRGEAGVKVALVILGIIIAMILIYARRDFDCEEIVPENGAIDVSEIDFSQEVYSLSNKWDYYPNHLLFPKDFAADENVPEPDGEVNPNDTHYGTYRLIVKGRPGTQLAFCGFSADYGARIFVNGAETAAYGVVADCAEDAVPGVNYMTVPFWIRDDGTAELIYQYSNFVHNEGGTIHVTFLSTPQNIAEFEKGVDLVSLVLSGGLMVLALYFLLLAVVLREKMYHALALCCFLMAVRDQIFFDVYLLPEGTSWYFLYRMQVAVVALLPGGFLLLMKSIYPVGNKRVHVVWLLGQALMVALIALADTRKLVAFSALSYVLAALYAGYLCGCVIVGKCRHREKKRKPTAADALYGVGLTIMLITIIIDGLKIRSDNFATRSGFGPSSMLIFALLAAIGTGLNTLKEQKALAESLTRNQMLERMNTLNLDFLHKVAHELKTPLTVISGYAQLTGMQIASNRISSDMPQNLKIVENEARRLADIVMTLMDYSCGRPYETTFSGLSVADLLERVNAVCTPLCLKNHNRVMVSCKGCGDIWGNAEMLLQVFINLIVNANRHTANGEITISASDRESREYVVFRVADTGDGIRAADLTHVFEKGYSGDRSSGLGLAICREVVEMHGGFIEVESTGKQGTVLRFTVLRKELAK